MSLKRDKLDAVFSDLVRERSNWDCDYCNKNYAHNHGGLHCSHIMGRRHTATRWHPHNAVAHCIGCHRKLGENPIIFADWAKVFVGAEEIALVKQLAWDAKIKISKSEKEELYQHYKLEKVRLQGLRNEGDQRRLEFTNIWYE